MNTVSSPIPSPIPSIIRIKSPASSNLSLKPFTLIRCSQADGPIRRPSAPSLSPPPSPPPLSPAPAKDSVASPPLQQQPPSPVKKPVEGVVGGVTFEYQRKVAKELQDYYRQKKLDEAADRGPFFGFIAKNEISNGRWAMFGFAVGLLTEYATGSDFVEQLKILLSNFGIVDLD